MVKSKNARRSNGSSSTDQLQLDLTEQQQQISIPRPNMTEGFNARQSTTSQSNKGNMDGISNPAFDRSETSVSSQGHFC
jgi:hypothetical protein